MNDTSSVLEDKEELVTEVDRFPIYFGGAGPGSFFDKVTIEHGEKKAKFTAPLRDLLKNIEQLSSVAPALGESIEREAQRLLSDLQRNPRNVYLLNNLGNTYLSMGAIEKATDCFERALRLNKGFRVAMVNLAKSYMLQDRPEEALKVYVKYTREYPDDAKAFAGLAHVCLRLEKLDEARVAVDRSITLNGNDAKAYHTSGILHLIAGSVDKAIAAFRRATCLDVHFVPAYTALGVCYAIKGSAKKSIRYFRIAYGVHPEGMYAAKNLAQAYRDVGDYEAAAMFMTEHLRKCPRDWEAQNALAYCYFKLGDYRRSLEWLRCLLSGLVDTPCAERRRAAAFNNIGVVYRHKGTLGEAEEMFRRSLLASDLPNPLTYFNLSRLLVDLGKREQARKLLEEYVVIAPDDSMPLVLLAQDHVNNGEYEEARDILDGILSRDPDCRYARVLLTSLNCEVFDDHESTIEMLKQEVAKDKSDLTSKNDLAYCYLRKGLVDEASDVLGTVDWDRATFPLYATKGLLQLSRGKLKEGIKLYDEAIGKAYGDEFKHMVRQKRDIEVARYFFIRGERDRALRRLRRALSVRTRTRLYKDQASRLLKQIEESPEQGRLLAGETQAEGNQLIS